MARDVEEVRREINEMHAQLEEATHYDLLGIDRESFDKSKLGGIFRNLAKKWHVDRYSSYDLGPDREKVQQIFSAINNAHRTLSNDSAREEYDMELDGEDAADIAALLSSESIFLKGKNFLKQGAYKGAFDQFEEAHELNPEDKSILVHKLYAEYLIIPKTKDGAPLNIKRAEEIGDALKEFDDDFENDDAFKVFYGTVMLGLGNERRAKYYFHEALMLNPNNMDAKRQQRLLEMRAEREANKGFFAKLMEKFKGG
mgnify:CR=1 FL=1